MGRIVRNQPVKLICGLLFKDEAWADKAITILRRYFGEVDFQSESVPFTQTAYYEKELGPCLFRKFLAFRRLIEPSSLADIKLITNRIENRLSRKGKRTVNLDPGYLELAKLILASTKNYSHRIYLGKGIYAELTLMYRGNKFFPLEWTYPDYRTEWSLRVMQDIRQVYYMHLLKK